MNVSITLQNTGDARAIIEAIAADNPSAKIQSFPAMVKIDCASRLVIQRRTVEEKVGRAWDLQELHLSLVSLSGNIEEDDDAFVIAWR
ncbi:MAG: MmoB/DmpM family protein [Labilithrix sp.]|nr:MmoB/DmpM family protein [Labilithrix sp.]MCW5832519.1 MmoB/DmpM family protein [Labilithrix sp.]